MTCRVLVVDDERQMRRGLKAYLEDEGYQVLLAGSGEEGLQVLASAQVDVAIVDMRLPGMDGNEFIEHAHRLCPEVKYLIHTGSANYFLPVALRTLGLTEEHLIRKPMEDLEVLAEALRRLLASVAEDVRDG
jgi:CheY-like chemotaxis protein